MIGAAARTLLPARVFGFVRRIGTAVLTPLTFSFDQGHFRSSIAGRAVTRAGQPLPWYTYPAIDFLNGNDFSGCSVLEFGAGQSTLWWAARARSVPSLEEDPNWYEHVRRSVPANASLHLIPLNLAGGDVVLGLEHFDIIVIDGLDRYQCAQRSLAHLAPGGAILLDNSDGYWGDVGHYPILDLFRSNDFQRVDFFGFAPGVIRPHCTSLFFRDRTFLLSGTENVRFLTPPGC